MTLPTQDETRLKLRRAEADYKRARADFLRMRDMVRVVAALAAIEFVTIIILAWIIIGGGA